MLPTGLSMLWEGVDPVEALRERFGFTGFHAAADWVSTALEATWGIAGADCHRLVISAQNAIAWARGRHGGLVVKWSRDVSQFERLAATTRVMERCAAQGLPVARPLRPLAGDLRVTLAGPAGPLSTAVLPELEGTWLDVADLSAVRAAGATLARLHTALGTQPLDPVLTPTHPVSPSTAIADWLRSGDRGWAPEESRRLSYLAVGLPELTDPVQLVHNDFRAANVLTRGAEVVGVLDFDDVRVDHRLSDLAKASVYLGTWFRDWRPTPAAAREALRAGYETVRPLGTLEAQWFEVVLLWQRIVAIPQVGDPNGWWTADL